MDFNIYLDTLKCYRHNYFPIDYEIDRKKGSISNDCVVGVSIQSSALLIERLDIRSCFPGMQNLSFKNYIETTSILKQLSSKGLFNNGTMFREPGLSFGK